MFRVINEYVNKITLKSDDSISDMFRSFLDNYIKVDIDKYSISVNCNQYVLDIRLAKYSLEDAELMFKDFNRAVAYPYSSLHVRFNEGRCVRYRYITCREDKEGFYCDMVIS